MRISPIVLALLGALLSSTLRAETIRFERLSIPWPDGYQLAADPHPVRYMGPTGQVVLISVYALDYELAESVAQRRVRERVEAGERLLQMAASRQGDIVVHITKEVLPSGLVLLSTATSTPDTDPPGFYVQFEWVNPKGEVAMLTAEGRDNARRVYDELLSFARRAAWP